MTTTVDNPSAEVLKAARTMKPSEFCASRGRHVPKWFNLDMLVTSDDVVEIETMRTELRAIVQSILPIAARIRRAAYFGDIAGKIDDDWPEGYEAEGSFELVNDALGLGEIQHLAQVAGYLLDNQSTIDGDNAPAVLKSCGSGLPGLEAALLEAKTTKG